MFVCTFRYRPKHVACYLCTEYKQKQGCTLPVCPWLAERIEAGVVGYQEAVMATIPRNRLLAPRLRALVASFPGSLWKDGTHKERMEYAKTRLHYYRRRDTPAFYAALFLLTSSAELWKRSANCFYRKGFEPAYAVLGGISPHDYALISAAKGLYRRCRRPRDDGACRPRYCGRGSVPYDRQCHPYRPVWPACVGHSGTEGACMTRFTIRGHDLLVVERFRDDTRYMVEFEVLEDDNLIALRGETARLFLSEQGYQKVLHSQELGKIHITDHALVVEGHIIRPKRKKHH